jgi:hypothetical protein
MNPITFLVYLLVGDHLDHKENDQPTEGNVIPRPAAGVKEVNVEATLS